jgi:hypothetical protein
MVFVNCYNFNPINSVKKFVFNLSYKYIFMEPGMEPEPKFGFGASLEPERKEKFSARNTERKFAFMVLVFSLITADGLC